MLAHSDPENAKRLLNRAQTDVNARWKHYEQLAALSKDLDGGADNKAAPAAPVAAAPANGGTAQ